MTGTAGRRGVVRRLAGPVARRAGIIALFRYGLERLAGQANLHLTRGMYRPYQPLRYEVFSRGTPTRTHLDYVRYGVLELICRRVEDNGVPGNAAEVGVANGDWARAVNTHLPGRQLYLFDTFNGFDSRDIEAEAKVGLPVREPYSLPPPASPAQVLSRLPHPHRAVVRAGRFPETSQGLQAERFCLVGVDVGVHEATRAALEWFYPRLAPGGFLIVSDYNNSHAPGVKIAVDDFVLRTGASLVPLVDFAASAVFAQGA
jgi:O-methyltransferase